MASSTASMCSNTRQATTASKLASAKGSAAAPRLHVGGATAAPGRLVDLGHGRIDAHDDRTLGGQATGQLALTGADVEHVPPTGEPLVGQRQDLLGVLRVDAVGELAAATSSAMSPSPQPPSGSARRSARPPGSPWGRRRSPDHRRRPGHRTPSTTRAGLRRPPGSLTRRPPGRSLGGRRHRSPPRWP